MKCPYQPDSGVPEEGTLCGILIEAAFPAAIQHLALLTFLLTHRSES